MSLARVLAIVVASVVATASYADEATITPEKQPIEVIAAPAQVALPTNAGAQQQYVIKCQLYVSSEDGESKPLVAPSIVVTEGHEGLVSIEGERPFVTGLRISDNGKTATPVITRIREGTQAKVTVTALNDEQVLVDAAFTVATIDNVEMIPAKDQDSPVTESPSLSTTGWRVVRTVSIGDSIELKQSSKDGDASATLIATIEVDRPGADEASITPISAVDDSQTRENESETIYTVLYSVEDLLEPYTQTMADEDLQETDFVLLMDMIYTHALTQWPKEASMRPCTEDRALVISQTRAGHREIGKLLRDSRENVALIEQHLRR